MSRDGIGALANLVGASAVVVTLAFLSVQLRQNTRATRAAITQAVLSAAAEYLEQVAASAELSDIWTRGLRELEALSAPERIRFGLLMPACFRRWEAVHLQATGGALSAEAWESLRAAMRDTVTLPGGAAWWRTAGPRFHASFRSFIDHLAEGR